MGFNLENTLLIHLELSSGNDIILGRSKLGDLIMLISKKAKKSMLWLVTSIAKNVSSYL